MQTNGGYFVGPGYVSNWSVPNSGVRYRRQSTAVLHYHAKQLKGGAWMELEMKRKRKRRVANYKSVAMERDVKASIRKGLRWLKNKMVTCMS